MKTTAEGMRALAKIARDASPPTQALRDLMAGKIVHRPKPAAPIDWEALHRHVKARYPNILARLAS